MCQPVLVLLHSTHNCWRLLAGWVKHCMLLSPKIQSQPARQFQLYGMKPSWAVIIFSSKSVFFLYHSSFCQIVQVVCRTASDQNHTKNIAFTQIHPKNWFLGRAWVDEASVISKIGTVSLPSQVQVMSGSHSEVQHTKTTVSWSWRTLVKVMMPCSA